MTTPDDPHRRVAPLVFIVAGEESGDRLGGRLMEALRKKTYGQVRFAGVGGHDMEAQGLESLVPLNDLAIVGITSIPRRLSFILRRIREIADAVVAQRPDVLVIIDSPEFTHRVARRVRKAMPGLPIVDYVSPSVWAWRPWRARAMRRYIDHVLALLPFEPDVHASLGGPPCSYIGHPLVEETASLRPGPAEIARRAAHPPVLLLLPGSRTSEVTRLLDVFGRAIELLSQRHGALDVVLPTVPHLYARVKAGTATWLLQPRVVVDVDEKRQAFRVARAALAASGTVSLELAVAGVPTVIAYKVPLIEEGIARVLVKVPSIVLANLVLGEKVMPELLQRDVTPARLADALGALIGDTPARQRQTEAFARLDQVMAIGDRAPSDKAADIVLDVARGGRSLADA